MLATLLLLAQLVLPGPPSGPIQPPGMICLGECAGPVVWGPAERGRLVVACDMRSDTCSDGRKITTVRATPVPCEVSPGVWEMVPEDTGCYSVRGLESWAQNTSYLSWGAEFDRSPWVVMSGSQLSALPEGGYRLCQTATEANTGLNQTYSAGLQAGEWVTAAVIARPNTASAMLLSPALSQFVVLQMTSEGWGRYFHSVVYAGSTQRVYIYPRPGGQQLCIDLLAAWLTKSDTPGRPCWGGEAPVTCAADRHTISTEGWPTEAGEVEIVFVYSAEASRPVRLIDSRLSSSDARHNVFISSLGGRLIVQVGSTNVVESGNLAWEDGRTYRVRVRRSAEGIMEVYRDGVLLAGEPAGAFEWGTSASLGVRYDGLQHLHSSIRSLTVRSFE